MIGSHPTTQRLNPIRGLFMIPAILLLGPGVLLAALVNYGTEVVRDWRAGK